MENYLPILIFAVFSTLFLVVTLLAARLLRNPGGGGTNNDPYECGNPPESYAHDRSAQPRTRSLAQSRASSRAWARSGRRIS